MTAKTRLLIVDDSLFYRAAMAKSLAACPGIEVVGEAYDPYDARDKILALEPDVMTLDIQMPYMNGLDFLRVLLPQWPIPVIVVSSAHHMEKEAMAAGALDFLPKPKEHSAEAHQSFSQELARRVLRLAEIHQNNRYRVDAVPVAESALPAAGGFHGFIVMGASTGGTQSTAKILKALPKDAPGFVIVQHMPPEFTRMYAENLDKDCAMEVREAKDGDRVERGVVLIAPGGCQHCEVVRRNSQFKVRLYDGEKVNGHCPSVDVLFHSVAKNAGPGEAIGIILTGMGADGAQGLLEMRQKGMFTLGQNQDSCVVYGMPREAFLRGAVCRQAPLNQIAALLLRHIGTVRG